MQNEAQKKRVYSTIEAVGQFQIVKNVNYTHTCIHVLLYLQINNNFRNFTEKSRKLYFGNFSDFDLDYK